MTGLNTAGPDVAPAQQGLDAMTSMLRAMADLAATFTHTMDQLAAFTNAHQTATTAGHGVVVERQPNGAITTTASAFLPAGSVIYIDSAAITDTPPGPPELMPDTHPANGGHLPSYTTRLTPGRAIHITDVA